MASPLAYSSKMKPTAIIANAMRGGIPLTTIRMPQGSFFSSFRKKPAKATKVPKAFAYMPMRMESGTTMTYLSASSVSPNTNRKDMIAIP